MNCTPADLPVMMLSALAIGVGDDADHWRLKDGHDDHRSRSIGGIQPQPQTDQPRRRLLSARSMLRPMDLVRDC